MYMHMHAIDDLHKMKMSAMPSSSELIGMPHTAHVMHAMHARATRRGKKYTYVAIDRDIYTCMYIKMSCALAARVDARAAT